MIYEYKGTEYELPDGIDDDEAMRRIKADTGGGSSQQGGASSKPNVITALFPSASKAATGGGKIAGALTDVLSLPTRGAAMLSGQKMGDPGSYLLKPAVTAINEKISQNENLEIPKPKFNIATPGAFVIPSPSVKESSEATQKMVGMGGAILSDPLTFVGTPVKAAGKGMVDLGKKITESVLGKGTKSIGKLQNVTLPKMAENALERGIIGKTSEETVSKANKALSTLDDGIDAVLSKVPSGKTINIDNVLDDISYKIMSDEKYMGNSDAIVNAIEGWRNALKQYGYTQDLPAAMAQKAKRAVGASAFKTKGIPTPDLQAKELAADEIKMAIAKEIEKVAPDIKQYNDIYRQVIPVKKSAQSRIWTEESRDVIGLGDIAATTGAGAAIGAATGLTEGEFNPKSLIAGALAGAAYRATKSGSTAQDLYNLGKGIGKVGSHPAAKTLSSGSKLGALAAWKKSEEEKNKQRR